MSADFEEYQLHLWFSAMQSLTNYIYKIKKIKSLLVAVKSLAVIYPVQEEEPPY